MKVLTLEQALKAPLQVEELIVKNEDARLLLETLAQFPNLTHLVLVRDTPGWTVVPPPGIPYTVPDSLLLNLPAEIGLLRRLQHLEVLGFYMEALPDAIITLPRLRQLQVSFTSATDLAVEAEKLQQLAKLQAFQFTKVGLTEEETLLFKNCLQSIKVTVFPEDGLR